MSPSDKAVNFLDKKSYTGRDKIATSWDKKAIVRIKWEEIKTTNVNVNWRNKSKGIFCYRLF